jgi:hypothetical protein
MHWNYVTSYARTRQIKLLNRSLRLVNSSTFIYFGKKIIQNLIRPMSASLQCNQTDLEVRIESDIHGYVASWWPLTFDLRIRLQRTDDLSCQCYAAFVTKFCQLWASEPINRIRLAVYWRHYICLAQGPSKNDDIWLIQLINARM